jgi:hypothetical protein
MKRIRQGGAIRYAAHSNVIRLLETVLRSRNRDPRNEAANRHEWNVETAMRFEAVGVDTVGEL